MAEFWRITHLTLMAGAFIGSWLALAYSSTFNNLNGTFFMINTTPISWRVFLDAFWGIALLIIWFAAKRHSLRKKA